MKPGERTDDRKDERGFTLVELMIALLLFSFAIAGILSVAVSLTRTFREQRRIIATEQATRAPLDFIVDVLRQASPAVGTSYSIGDADSPCTSGTTGTISVTPGSSAPDALEVVYASGGVASTSQSAVTSSSTSITLPAVHASQFSAGDAVLVSNGTQGTLINVTGTGTTSLTIAPASACSANFPAGGYASGAILVRAQRAKFTIANLDGIPTLWMDPDGAGSAAAEPIAEGVEDMQVALGYDSNNDGAVSENGAAGNDDEWYGNNSSDTLPAGNLTIRAVRVVLIARETSAMLRAIYTRPAALDRSASSTPDKYRRRVLESTVEIRNLTGSP